MKKVILLSLVATMLVLVGCDKTTETSNSVVTEKSSSEQVTKNSSKQTIAFDVETAISSFQEKFPTVDITEVSFESKLGNDYFTVKGVDDTDEYELILNATDGSIEKERQEKLDRDEQNGIERQEKINTENLKSMNEIITIAETEVAGSEFKDAELKQELTVTFWEINLKVGQTQESAVSINAETGEILEVELDD